jgi:hypothetical protein
LKRVSWWWGCWYQGGDELEGRSFCGRSSAHQQEQNKGPTKVDLGDEDGAAGEGDELVLMGDTQATAGSGG